MKSVVLLTLLLAVAIPAGFAQTANVTACEWFTGADPGAGNGNAISIGAPGSTVNLAFVAGTSSLLPGCVRVKVRCRADSLRNGRTAIWGPATDGFLVIGPQALTTRLVTQFEYAIDGGTPTLVDIDDGDQVNIAQSITTGSLSRGLHKFRIRLLDNVNRTGEFADGFFYVDGTPPVARLVTHFEYAVDDGAPTLVDVADSPLAFLEQQVTTGTLTAGLHKLRMRPQDDLGRMGRYTDGFFLVAGNPFVARQITHIEYWFNNETPRVLDVSDAPTVNFNELIATAGLPVGLNRFNIRMRDDLGRTGPATNRSLVVISAFGPGAPRTITAAEFYVNVDPGPGNGVPIPLPDDGAFDEAQESVSTVLTGVPIGMHFVGMRVRDNSGRWSAVMADSLLVGPVLVVRSSGSNILLNWDSGPGVTQFKIYRAATFGGTYALYDSTTAQTYTDVGAIDGAFKRFYYVTFEADGFSTFRLPEATPKQE